MTGYKMCQSGIDLYLWDTEKYLMGKVGCDEAKRVITPLKRFIVTGRASASWIRMLYQVKPYVIGRLLLKGGSDDEMMARVQARVWKNAN